MKIKAPKKLKQAGTALLVALVLGSILCISVVGYLSVSEQQNYLSMRSQVWNTTITVVEAGLEEGIQHMDAYPTAPAQDGWQFDGTWYYHPTTLPNGDSYTVYAICTNPSLPVIICKATVTSPTLFAKASSPFMFAAQGTPSGNSVSPTVTRAVQVRTKRSVLFTKAMVAKHQIDMNGNGLVVDSFDSGNWNYSNYGKYDVTSRRSNGDVASNDTIANSIGGGNANVYGHVATGPNGTISIGSQGAVGSVAWQATHTGAIEPNNDPADPGQVWSAHDSNFTFSDTTLAYSGGLPLGAAADIVTTKSDISSNYVAGSSSYPNPVPWSGVNTNGNNYVVDSSSWPGSQWGVQTNNVISTSPSFPSPGTYVSVSTNTTSTSGGAYPSSGTYLGSIITNYTWTAVNNSQTQPSDGTYVPGSLVHRNNGRWDYNLITSRTYVYNRISGYTYNHYTYTYPTALTYNYANYGTNVTFSTNHYDMVINSGDYYVTDLPSGALFVSGTARLVIANGLNMGGSDSITIGNNGSLTLYSGGTQNKISGNGVINKSGYAQNFIMYSAPSVTSFSFDGNGEFIGVICAPNAAFQMNGGGKSNNDFEGALVASSVKMNGHYSFHYDEILGRLPNIGRLLITSWDEIDPKSSPSAGL